MTHTLKTKRFAALLLAAAMLPVNGLPVLAEEGSPDSGSLNVSKYTIYPVPHEVSYPSADLTDAIDLTGEVNVVYETGVDEDTKSYLCEILEENELQAQISDAVVPHKNNILIGIQDSHEYVDTWYDALDLNAELFEKTDAYALDVHKEEDGTGIISILGKDSNAAFYGLSSLQMMTKSAASHQFPEVSIRDYANGELRGFIEGFYGGFDYAARESQIRFLRNVKGNMYVFASKTDPYHGGSSWQNLYPKEELDQIAGLVKVARQNKVRYAWSFHAGKSNFLTGVSTSPNDSGYAEYQQRLDALKAKFQQLYDIGVRDFHILNDDYNSGSFSDIVVFLNDINAWLKEKGCGPLVYCPINYNINWGNTANEMAAYKGKLDEDILLYWTGRVVNCPVTQSDVDWVYERSGAEVVNWLNYPCSEHDKAGIYLGSISNYFSTADQLQHSKGLMSNPVNFPEANKVAYFQLMSWLWNNDNYSEYADELWLDSFNYLEPEVADSYRIIAKNLSNCPESGRYPDGFPESEYLKETLASVLAKIKNKADLADDAEAKALVEEFAAIDHAVDDFKANCTNEGLLSDLGSWLNSLQAIARAGKESLEAAMALQEGDLNRLWSSFSKASSELSLWDSYSNREYPEKKAKAGSKRLQPFVSDLTSWLSGQILPELNPSYDGFVPAFYSNYPANASSANMLDGDPSTYAFWQRVQQAGDYYGVDLGREIPVHSIEILQGQNDTHHDRFHESTLEYSADGQTWTPIAENINASVIRQDNLEITARYIRLRVTGFTDPGQPGKNDFWTFVREFAVNKQDAAASLLTGSASVSASIEENERGWRLLLDEAATLQPGQYLGMQLPKTIYLSDLEVDAACSGLAAEYSLDGQSWSSETIAPRKAVKYVRLKNSSELAASLGSGLLLTAVKGEGAKASVSQENLDTLRDGAWANLVDGSLNSYVWTGVNQAAGQSITVDFGRELPYHALSLYMTESRPRLYHGKVSVSKDGLSWQEVMNIDINDDVTTTDGALRYARSVGNGEAIRYVRIDVTGEAAEAQDGSAYLKLHEVLLNDAPIPEDKPSAFTGSGSSGYERAADQNLSTFFTPAAGDEEGWFEWAPGAKEGENQLILVQDAASISEAVVSVLQEDGSWKPIGTLNQPVTRLDAGETPIRKIRIAWSKDKPALRLYEIFAAEAVEELDEQAVVSVQNPPRRQIPAGSSLDSLYLPKTVAVRLKNGTSSILPVVWQTESFDPDQAGEQKLAGILQSSDPVSNPKNLQASLTLTVLKAESEEVNLALNQPVSVSGLEVAGQWTGDLAVDGDKSDADSRWSSGLMKQGKDEGQQQTPQWLQVDLGEGISQITRINTDFHLLVYATDYSIETSLDGNNWSTVAEHQGLAPSDSNRNPSHTIEFETPAAARYVRFACKEMNHLAGGNALSIKEFEVFGTREAAPEATLDYAPLEQAIDKARLLKGSYEEAGENALQNVLAESEALLKTADTQTVINEQAKTLNQALLELRIPASEENLEAL